MCDSFSPAVVVAFFHSFQLSQVLHKIMMLQSEDMCEVIVLELHSTTVVSAISRMPTRR